MFVHEMGAGRGKTVPMEPNITNPEGEGWRRTGTQRKEEQTENEGEAEENAKRTAEKGETEGEEEEDVDKEAEVLDGVASIALFPSGSLSGHFLHSASSSCWGLFGTEIACERECSRGEDYRLLNLTIINFKTKKETTVVVERKGEDAARLSTTCDLHGWDEEVVVEANKRHRSGDASPVITFECETLKADTEAEDHIKKFMPSLVGRDAVVNIGPMTIKGLSVNDKAGSNRVESQVARAHSKRSLEDTLRLVFGDMDHTGMSAVISSESAHKRQVISNGTCSLPAEESEVRGIFKSTPIHHAPCDFDDDF
ncbi:hypothetical protein M758_8G180500 [Ceratodon purpureus]|nr:hypothetical protein M758_8G180500 [Ceratodon purpureus]